MHDRGFECAAKRIIRFSVREGCSVLWVSDIAKVGKPNLSNFPFRCSANVPPFAENSDQLG